MTIYAFLSVIIALNVFLSGPLLRGDFAIFSMVMAELGQ